MSKKSNDIYDLGAIQTPKKKPKRVRNYVIYNLQLDREEKDLMLKWIREQDFKYNLTDQYGSPIPIEMASLLRSLFRHFQRIPESKRKEFFEKIFPVLSIPRLDK